jgi:hypothetical protein
MPESNTPNAPQQKPVDQVADQAALVGLTKRQQLKKTNKTIFIWVAAAAVVLAFSLVALQFLVRQGLFNGKIIKEQQATNRALDESKANVEDLKRNVDALLADTRLSSLRANPSDNSLQVVLDALPTSGDPTTFSNSLYNKILSRHGVSITGVTVGSGAAVDPAAVAATATNGTSQSLAFEATIVGSPEQIQNTLMDIEKVIRPMVVRQLNITVNGAQLDTSLTGETYYLPRSTVTLGDKTIKP